MFAKLGALFIVARLIVGDHEETINRGDEPYSTQSSSLCVPILGHSLLNIGLVQ